MKEYLLSPLVIAGLSTLLFVVAAGNLALAFQGSAFLDGDWWRLFTFPFVHVSPSHLAQNLAALAVSTVLAYELVLGPGLFVWLFSLSNIVLALAALAFFPDRYLAGASFGVYAITGGLSLTPNPYVQVPVLFGLLFGITLLGHVTNASAAVHVMGFLIGSGIALVRRKHRPMVFTNTNPSHGIS
ncbi:rhomboid family intramembrane serine protease [Candidatus Woesearchaeota archaeon]|nr:rhomboid family intramembrane serine protease [Candidatus Woesearchaeota archaeon]